jgi:ankyrin repeat protein
LHAAAYHGDLPMVDLLLRHGADPNIPSGTLADEDDWSPGQTPLIFAAWRGHGPVVLRLMEAGADVNLAGEYDGTALHAAVSGGHADVVRILLQAGANVDATYYRHTHDPEFCTEYGLTPLHGAARDGLTEICSILLKHQANVNRPDMLGQVPLHYAARRSNTAVVRLLLDAGARVDACRKDQVGLDPFDGTPGYTPLHYATEGPLDANEGHQRSRFDPTVIELLVKHGAKVDETTQHGETPLHLATFNGWVEGVAALIRLGASVNVGDCNGWTPLHRAVGLHEGIGSANTRFAICAMLLASGADLMAKTALGESPWSEAQACEDAALINLLTRHRRKK